MSPAFVHLFDEFDERLLFRCGIKRPDLIVNRRSVLVDRRRPDEILKALFKGEGIAFKIEKQIAGRRQWQSRQTSQ
jgi:hypothetical protein